VRGLSEEITEILISRQYIKRKVDKFHAMAATKAQRGSRRIFVPILNLRARCVWVRDILNQIEMKKPSLMWIKYAELNEKWSFIVVNL
jgi:hypothetical protein